MLLIRPPEPVRQLTEKQTKDTKEKITPYQSWPDSFGLSISHRLLTISYRLQLPH